MSVFVSQLFSGLPFYFCVVVVTDMPSGLPGIFRTNQYMIAEVELFYGISRLADLKFHPGGRGGIYITVCRSLGL